MGIEHLNGKRTGRRPGTKSRPPWERGLLWAYKNLDRPEANPPSALAGRLLTLGREHPDRLFACLALLDARRSQAGRGAPLTPGRAVRAAEQPERLRKLFVGARHLVDCLTGAAAAWVSNLPADAYLMGCEPAPGRDGIFLLFYANRFPPVALGAPVPEIEAELVGNEPR
jgi:hypothetical protein